MDLQKIGMCLRELRKEKGLTQEQLAERFGVSGKTVSRWENGVNMPDLELLLKLADFYEVDLRALLKGERMSAGTAPETKETMHAAAEYNRLERIDKNQRKKKRAGMAILIAALVILVLFFVVQSVVLHCVLNTAQFGSVKMGDKSYYLLPPIYVDSYDESMFLRKELQFAKIDDGVMVVPRFQYAGTHEDIWKFYVGFDVYSMKPNLAFEPQEVVLSFPNAAQASFTERDSIELTGEETAEDGVSKISIWCRDSAEIPASVLDGAKTGTLIIRYSLEGKVGTIEYSIQVSTDTATVWSLLFE